MNESMKKQIDHDERYQLIKQLVEARKAENTEEENEDRAFMAQFNFDDD